MEKLTRGVLLLLLVGCSSPAPTAPRKSVAVATRPPPKPRLPTYTTNRWVLPPNATNYYWFLEESTNLVSWRTVWGNPPPDFFVFTTDAPFKFYRLHGVTNSLP